MTITPFLDILKEAECYLKFLPTTSATCQLFSCRFYQSMNIDVFKKVLLYYVIFGYEAKL